MLLTTFSTEPYPFHKRQSCSNILILGLLQLRTKFFGGKWSGGPFFVEFWSPGPIFSPDQNFRDSTRVWNERVAMDNIDDVNVYVVYIVHGVAKLIPAWKLQIWPVTDLYTSSVSYWWPTTSCCSSRESCELLKQHSFDKTCILSINLSI